MRSCSLAQPLSQLLANALSRAASPTLRGCCHQPPGSTRDMCDPDDPRPRGGGVCCVRQRACSAALVAKYLERMRFVNTTQTDDPTDVKPKVLDKALEFTQRVAATAHLPSGTPLLGIRPYKITRLFSANCPSGFVHVPTVTLEGELGAFAVHKLQVILVEAMLHNAPLTRPTDITAGFDIDVCGVSFDVRADAPGLRALSFAFDAGLEEKLGQLGAAVI